MVFLDFGEKSQLMIVMVVTTVMVVVRMKCDGGNESDCGDCANDGDDHSGNESDDDGGNGNELWCH